MKVPTKSFIIVASIMFSATLLYNVMNISHGESQEAIQVDKKSNMYSNSSLPVVYEQFNAAQADKVTFISTKSDLSKAAVTYLIHEKEEERVKESLTLLYKNFLEMFPYPVILFYDESYSDEALQRLQKFTDTLPVRVMFRRIDFKFPSNFNPEVDKEVIWPGVIGYKLMIRFWFYEVFNLMSNYDFYMRMDTDSFIHSKITYDPFKVMEKKGYTYAYRYITEDASPVCEGMLDFIDKYAKEHDTLASVNNLYSFIPAPEKRRDYLPQMFYNNFEIAKIDRFLSKDILEFKNEVDKTKRIFTHRWGDAPLRFYESKLFLDWKREVWHFCDFVYEHRNHKLTFQKC
ncbi:nucleotide-diphospho-sugar transferase [Rozella allomycis CSF55]|uniref:Glycosyl transferase, family 15 domain-containing protein n=1 Tax=Rozella allomycis (strain CSF55) TaxID=988480 RepID=A0A075AQ50_ROZAC|nr:Glycosyl transferase, family 15 domain-containing protein [Rozella allomycis CSF55]RKP20696.1 nucleotide-diphospho-sugar transferase [Rozella allomycis CSF55]|eukprot:EPZ32371.1 Glycosyl transferase, family 15 domain-containing protein [Rozella allomycis CSF55]